MSDVVASKKESGISTVHKDCAGKGWQRRATADDDR